MRSTECRSIVGFVARVLVVYAGAGALIAREPAPHASGMRDASASEVAKSFGLAIGPSVPASIDGVAIRVVDASGQAVGDALVISVDEVEFTYSAIAPDE